MRKSSWFAGALAAGLLLTGVPAAMAAKTAADAKHKSIPQIMREYGFKHQTASWKTVSTTQDGSGKTTTHEAKLWLSGDMYRMESKDEKGKTLLLLDDGTGLVMVQPDEKKAFKWGPSAESMFGSVFSSDIVAESARQRKTAKKLGRETIEGKPCEIYAYTSKMTIMNNPVTSEVKEWLWTAEKFPLKSVVNTPKHQMKIMFMTQDVPASETTSVIKDLVLDQPVDAALFKVPAGITVETLQMPPTLGGAPAGEAPEARPRNSGSAGANAGGEGEDGEEGGAEQQPPVDVNKLIKGLF